MKQKKQPVKRQAVFWLWNINSPPYKNPLGFFKIYEINTILQIVS